MAGLKGVANFRDEVPNVSARSFWLLARGCQSRIYVYGIPLWDRFVMPNLLPLGRPKEVL